MRTVTRRSMRTSPSFAEARRGFVRATLLFGSAVAALSLSVVPEADRRAKLIVAERIADTDDLTTGSIAATGRVQRYTVHRSVLDTPDRGPCIMFPDGSQKGAC